MGNGSPEVSGRTAAIVIVGFIALIIISMAYAMHAGKGKHYVAPQPKPKQSTELDYIRLHPVVKYEDGYMWVKNKDPFTWANVEMTINDKFFGGGYSCDRRLIPSEQYVKIPIGEFADSDQNRFNLLQKKLDTFTIVADTPKGQGIFTGQMTFQ